MTTTTDFYEALQQLPDKDAAKIAADYVEETRQLNLERMKEIFATKEDLYKVKDELHKEISSAKWQVIFVIIGAIVLQPVIAFMYKHYFGIN